MRYIVPTPDQQGEMAHVPNDLDHGQGGGDWTVTQASAVAVTRGQAGCPLRTLACWSPEQKVEVLIGSLDSVHNRPKLASLTALGCH